MDYKGNVTVKIDGIAASAASVIAMAGTKVLVSPVSMMMIHNPATVAFGDSSEMQKAISMLDEVKESIINAYARVAQDQDEYNKRYNALVERYDRLKAQYDEVSATISNNEARYEQMGRFITVLKDQTGIITEFDDALWSSLVEKIVVKSKDDVTVVFKDGTEIKAE